MGLVSMISCGPAGFHTPENLSSASKGIPPAPGTLSGDPAVWKDNDPLLKHTWYLFNQGDVFNDRADIGIDIKKTQSKKSGLGGEGVTIGIVDTGFDLGHPELRDNQLTGRHLDFTTSAPFTSTASPPVGDDQYGNGHGTFVAGLIAAKAANGAGSQGVAPKSLFAGMNLIGSDASSSWDNIAIAMGQDVDVSNNSWGASQDILSVAPAVFANAISAGASSNREGKGTLYVKASGNNYVMEKTVTNPRTSQSQKFVRFGNAQFNVFTNVMPVLQVGALDFFGIPTDYSSPGANIWLSAPGGDIRGLQILSTDRQGCDVGISNLDSRNASSRFSHAVNGSCAYGLASGTSFAAPLVSGAIALMLETNPSLNWRDVKHILAKTARKIYPTAPATAYPIEEEEVLPGVNWEDPWTTNAAGFHFHNFFGFGLLDTDAAVKMAKDGVEKVSDKTLLSGSATSATNLDLSIPDFNGAGVQNTLNVTEAMDLEHVAISLRITHADIGDLGVQLTSPSGTHSIVIPFKNSLVGEANYMNETFVTNAFYGERSAGTWTLKVLDANRGISGKLDSWRITVQGH